jgi:RimJ/RimL family protein N-acetyltransferase
VALPESTTPRIATERLLLREWQKRDLEPFAEMNGDPLVMEHFPRTLTRGDSDALVGRIRASWAANGYGLWAVATRADDTFLGFTGLALHTFEAPFTPAVEIGWRFARGAWSRGYATEAATAALRYGFETVGLPEILSWTAATNQGSRRLMERIGLIRDLDGDFEHPNVPAGHPARPHVLYRLSRTEWLDREATRG